MFSNLYLLSGYNNYLNRTLKYEETIADYIDKSDAITFSGINFNPNDEVTTEQILNVGDYNTFDYLIVQDQESGNISSRWFVIDKTRIRNGQWKLSLRRDVVADYWNIIKVSPCFIEKAILNYDDPRIFNSEDMTFNQIKTNEKLIKDKSGCPWIIGYYAKDKSIKGDGESNVGIIPNNEPLSIPFIQLDSTLEGWDFYHNSNLAPDQAALRAYDSYKYIFNITNASSDNYYWKVTLFDNKNVYNTEKKSKSGYAEYWSYGLKAATSYNNKDKIGFGMFSAANEINAIETLNSIAPTYISAEEARAQQLLTYQGKTIRTQDGKVYKVTVNSSKIATTTLEVVSGTEIYIRMEEIAARAKANGVLQNSANMNSKTCNLVGYYYDYTISLEEIDLEELTYDMATPQKLITEDAPYNIFAIPYGEIDVYNGQNDTFICSTNASIAMSAAMAIQINNPGIVYDIQVLPYCPLQELLLEKKEIYPTDEKQYSLIKKGNDVKGVIFNVPYGRFTFNINELIKPAATALKRKVSHQCDKWRLVSPNYSNYFDFSVEMNDGIDYFNVDCEYKPYTPYIHINPNFKYLYGQDFNDPRGLICGGDFSIAAVVDQWEQYQIQNKNFQNIFDRQIENMEVNNSVQAKMEKWAAAAGTLQGAASGAMIGSMAGGGILGAAAGAVLGGTISGIGGVQDIKYNQMLRNEAIDFTKDNFGYQLGNIQALPNTLSRVSAFNNNNKLFPVLEYYTATDVEKEALENKIKYNGMTVMCIGTIEDYVTYDESYIKGKIIRMPLLSDDFHVANNIVQEINQGLYIQGGNNG